MSLPYVQNRIRLIAEMTLQEYRDLGEDCFNKYYTNKIFKPMEELIQILKRENLKYGYYSISSGYVPTVSFKSFSDTYNQNH